MLTADRYSQIYIRYLDNDMLTRDVVIVSLPFIQTDEPMMAPALLKGIVNKTSLSSIALDLNIEIINRITSQHGKLFDRLTDWFLYQDHDDCNETQSAVSELVQYSCDRILSYDPRWVCLSLFCDTAKKFNIALCRKIRQANPNLRIVIGGNAVFTDEKSRRPYALILKRAKLIDHYIVGDGEEPLYNLLTGGSTDGVDVDQFQILEDLNQQPYSDYSDYPWHLYNTKRVPMYGSRGCVRRCTFCDVYKLWKKFKLRDSEVVFNEMLYQIEQTGVRRFYFRDSLINGSISEYRRLLRLMADYNFKNPEQPMRWTSFFIFRPREQMPEEDWKLTADSGAEDLIVGVESLVDSIRYHMRKKFTNHDIDFALEMGKKYHVGITMLLIIGYVNETEEDFQSSIQWLKDHQQYAGFPIHAMDAGGTLTVADLSDLYQNAEDFDITIGNKIYLWENKKINLDYATRERRKLEFVETARRLGYPIDSEDRPVTGEER
jgi:hypothetical protein